MGLKKINKLPPAEVEPPQAAPKELNQPYNADDSTMADQHRSSVTNMPDSLTRAQGEQNPEMSCAREDPDSQQPQTNRPMSESMETRWAQKRERVKKGKHILPPAKFELHVCLTFLMSSEKERNGEICTLPIVAGKIIHHHTLESLNIKYGVFELICDNGWESHFKIDFPIYVELVGEFYAIFQFKKVINFTLKTPNLIIFRLMGKRFSFSIIELNKALGFVSDAPCCDFCDEYDAIAIYANFYDNPPDTFSKAKDLYLRNPCLKYIHRFLSYSFLDRKDASSIPSKTELYFLWCMTQKKKKSELRILVSFSIFECHFF